MRICFVLIGNLPITHMRKMFLIVYSTALFYPPVSPNSLETPATLQLPILGTDSASLIPLNAVHVVLHVQLLENIVMVVVSMVVGPVSLPPVLGLLIEKMQGPHVLSLLWNNLKMGTAQFSAAVCLQLLELQLVNNALKKTFLIPAQNCLVPVVGTVEDQFWKSGESVQSLY